MNKVAAIKEFWKIYGPRQAIGSVVVFVVFGLIGSIITWFTTPES